jgi:hypothetical protein
MPVRGFSIAQTEVEGICNLYRAGLGAFTTSGAFAFVNISRFSPYLYLKIANKSRDRFDLCVGE